MPVLAPERDVDETSLDRPSSTDMPHLFRPRGRRAPIRRRAGWGVGRMAVALVLAALALVGVARLGDLLPNLHNPFQSRTVDRTGPVVLKAVTDLHEYRAATGTFQVLVDLEKDTKYVPALLKGERTLFVALGSVDASIDFSKLDSSAVAVSSDRRSATLTIPHAVLSPAHVDPAKSYVADRDRGLLDRIGSVFTDSPTSERALFQVAEQKIADAARADDGLRARAEENTRQMLTSLLGSLGFTSVAVTFV